MLVRCFGTMKLVYVLLPSANADAELDSALNSCAPRVFQVGTKTVRKTVTITRRSTNYLIKTVFLSTAYRTVTKTLSIGRRQPKRPGDGAAAASFARDQGRNLCPICPAKSVVFEPYSGQPYARLCCPRTHKFRTITVTKRRTKTVFSRTIWSTKTLTKTTSTITAVVGYSQLECLSPKLIFPLA
jgi:hypothetical protein